MLYRTITYIKQELRFYNKLPFVFMLEDDGNSVEVEVLGRHYDAYDISRYSENDHVEHTFISTVDTFMEEFARNRVNDKARCRSLVSQCLKPFKLSDFA